MNRHRLANAIFGLTGILTLCGAQELSPPNRDAARPPSMSIGDTNADAVLGLLRPALYSVGKVGRIDYRATCQSGPGYDRVLFPKIATHALPPQKRAGLVAFQQMFRTNENVVVTEARSGIIKVTIGRVSNALLQTKITNLTLTPDEQFNVPSVFAALENNESVKVAMRDFGLRPAYVISIYGETTPANRLPHLPAAVHDTTVDQVLDRIALTFKGIVLYGTCTNSPAFQLQFISLAGFPPAIPR